MFLPLEEDGLVDLGRVVALVREGNERWAILRDGSVMATGFTPMTPPAASSVSRRPPGREPLLTAP